MYYSTLLSELNRVKELHPELLSQEVRFAVDSDDLYNVNNLGITEKDETYDDGEFCPKGTLILKS